MARTYRSPITGKVFKTIPELIEDTYKKENIKKLPRRYKGNVERFLYDYRNGPGKCQVCGAPTKWDDEKKRYKILCEPGYANERKVPPKGKVIACIVVCRKTYEDRMNRSYGTINLMEDPEYINKLLQNRKIAKVVKFKKKEMTVIGSYEAEFVKVCDKLLKKENDLEAPGPTVNWLPKGSFSPKMHITDFYIHSIKCVVSIKDEANREVEHPSIQKKRLEDTYKFKGIIDDKKKYKAIVELNGLQEIRNFPKMYKEIQEFQKKNKKERYIKYPNYWDKYIGGIPSDTNTEEEV